MEHRAGSTPSALWKLRAWGPYGRWQRRPPPLVPSGLLIGLPPRRRSRHGESQLVDSGFVHWMTLQELRVELDRTRPAYDALADLDEFLDSGQPPALGEEAHRHQVVQSELMRRPSNGQLAPVAALLA